MQKPCLFVNTPRARKGRRGRDREEEKRRRKEESKGAPSYDTSVQGHTKKEGLPARTKASRDTQGRRKVKKGKKERERGREKRGRRRAGVPSYEQASRDTPVRERGDPKYSGFRKTPDEP